MDVNLLDAIIDQIIENKVFQVVFTGGECLLVKETLFHGLRRLISNGISCTVNSNLTVIQKADAETLYQVGVRGILTSVSSHNPETHDRIFHHKGAFDQAMRGIKICLDAGIGIAASMVLIKENVDDVIPTGLMLKSMGVRQFFATKASPPVNAVQFQRFMLAKEQLLRAMDDLNTLKHEHGMDVGILECYPLCSYGLPDKYPFVAERRCSAGVTTITIGSNGDVRPCSHSDKVYGNMAKEGLRKSWESMGDQRDGSLLPQVCRTCELLSHCSGGCRVDAFCCSSRYDALDPYANPGLVKQIVPGKRDIGRIDDAERFSVSPRLKFREETIGILCTDPNTMAIPVMLTPDTRDLILGLNGKEFDVAEVCNYTDLSCDDARQLCGMLVADRIFLKS